MALFDPQIYIFNLPRKHFLPFFHKKKFGDLKKAHKANFEHFAENITYRKLKVIKDLFL